MNCAHCGLVVHQQPGHLNRAKREGRRVFCNRTCAGLARRLVNPPTDAERREAKRLYDAEYRAKNYFLITAKKAKHYAKTADREKERAYRAANMHKHVAYCQRPEYVAWKQQYDMAYKARKDFGEFSEAALLLRSIEQEIDARASRYEVYSTNGTLNKAQTRRRSL